MITRRDYDRELYHPKKAVTFDGGHHRGSQGSDSDSDFWSEAERKTTYARNKKLLYTGLATVTSIGAINGLYQSTKAHQQRAKQLREGTLSKNEAADLKKEHVKRDLISVGLIAVSAYNTRLGWQRWKGKQVEEQKIREEFDVKKNEKVRDEYDIKREIRA
ncbi:MAG: hypothetical protein Q9198_006553 [Flavoplaca austrocitrina]